MADKMTAQDLLNKEFLEDDTNDSNQTLDLFRFMRDESTSLTENQLKAMLLLNEYGLEDLTMVMLHSKRLVTPNNLYFKLLDKLTLADRIKGNAKLSHLMKSTANPAETLSPKEVQAQGMSRREIDRY